MDEGVIWLNLRTHYRYSITGEFEFGNIGEHNGFIYLAGLTYNYTLFDNHKREKETIDLD